jgi:hypothetical protein
MVATGQMKLMLGGCEGIRPGRGCWPHQAHTFRTVPQAFIENSIASLYSNVELSEEPVNSNLYDQRTVLRRIDVASIKCASP